MSQFRLHAQTVRIDNCRKCQTLRVARQRAPQSFVFGADLVWARQGFAARYHAVAVFTGCPGVSNPAFPRVLSRFSSYLRTAYR